MAKGKTYIVTVKDNPEYCGVGAGGAQFAHGRATISDERMASWFQEHEGYTVTEVTDKSGSSGNNSGNKKKETEAE